MREINFRVWDPVQYKMLKPSYLEFIDGNAYWVEAGEDDSQNDGPIDSPVTRPMVKVGMALEQYTGLKDDNGKGIYEGDIVCVWDNGTGFVTFKNGSFIVDLGPDDNSSLSSEAYPLLTWNSEDYEIVGNIHKNPDLLEAPHD
ncbi:YopX family protein [Levilactobacillus wangkuiensis]|uniref:YopX family protein n=1 Tax=Levilactobacillus wangkuiensis TaxID=2799566 RepID=UPI00194F43E3|nr:YopX family protein [Levilactobacillus wangkuiensis]